MFANFVVISNVATNSLVHTVVSMCKYTWRLKIYAFVILIDAFKIFLSYTIIYMSTKNMWEHAFPYIVLINTLFSIFWVFTNLLGKKGVLNILFTFISLMMIENFFMFKNHSYFHFDELSIYIPAHFSSEWFFSNDLEICTLFVILVAIIFFNLLGFWYYSYRNLPFIIF